MEELWKHISGFDGVYSVSNFGRVKSTHFVKGVRVEKILTLTESFGYKYVHLYDKKLKKHSRLRVHRLVATAFIPNPCNYNSINHKDENRANNNVDNLEWCSSAYNNNYGTRNMKLSHTKKQPCSTEEFKASMRDRFCKAVVCIETGVVYKSVTEAAEFINCHYNSIRQCCLGVTNSVFGLHWKYAEVKNEI